jgi:hypothetical protein
MIRNLGSLLLCILDQLLIYLFHINWISIAIDVTYQYIFITNQHNIGLDFEIYF